MFSWAHNWMDQKGMNLNHDFYLLLVNNVLQKMRRWVTNTISLYKLTNVLLLSICFKLKIVIQIHAFLIHPITVFDFLLGIVFVRFFRYIRPQSIKISFHFKTTICVFRSCPHNIFLPVQ